MSRQPTIWMAEEGSISVNGQLLSTRVTNIEVTGGARGAEMVRTFGRGEFYLEKPQEDYETTITAVVSGLEFDQYVMGAGSTTTTGQILSGNSIRPKINVVYSWADPTDANGQKLRLRFASGFAVENTLSEAADGYLEQSFKFRALPGNSFKEYSSGGALVIAAL